MSEGLGSGSVTVEQHGAIAIVRFDRKGSANALSFAVMDDLCAIARRFERASDVAAVVLVGAERVFSGGMDLKDETWQRLERMSIPERREVAAHGPRLARAWTAIEPVTIAAIEGACFGGGVALAAFCDFRVAGRSARFATPEVGIGLNMAWHSVPRILRLVGLQPTRRLLLLGETWTASAALGHGFLDEVTEDGGALARGLAMAEHLAARPQVATRMVKRSIEVAAHSQDLALSAVESDLQLVNWVSEDFARARAEFARRAKAGS
ncbi:MAG: enoyl-CoA hydratase/isomerase family protein [Hyphomicrobiaceae bacterium]|nr:enoyl-CoA hydratase/isomerase family protein [Hyphomicrobiaceae bacterium]